MAMFLQVSFHSISIHAVLFMFLSFYVLPAYQISFNFSNFAGNVRNASSGCLYDDSYVCLYGDASASGDGGINLTYSWKNSVGRAVYSKPVRIWNNSTGRMANFTTEFTFHITEVLNYTPGDACTSLAAEGKEGYGKGCMLSLRHPKSGEKTGYLFRDGSLQEFQWFKQYYGSWFLGDCISEDGGLYILTPVDPVFLLLPLFLEARMQKGNNQGMFRELSEIFYVDGFPGYQHLLPVAEDSMKLLCELKEIGSSKFFRLDDSKVLVWMCYKVSILKEALPKLDQNYAARTERDKLLDVVSMLGEYLVDDPWLNLLCKHFKLDLQETVRERCNDGILKAVESHQTHGTLPLAKNSNGRSTSSSGKQPKKQRTQVESKNIKDMFRRVTRSGGT